MKKWILTHQVEVDAVIDKVILARLDILRSREVDTESLAGSLDSLIVSGQTNHILMELLQILLCDLGSISCRITCNEDRSHDIAVLLLNIVDHASHLVQLFRANVRAVREAKVDQRVFSFEILFGEGLAIVIDQVEGATNQGTTNTFAVFGDALAGHAFFLVAEVESHSDTSTQEEKTSLPTEGTESVARLCLFYSLVAHC